MSADDDLEAVLAEMEAVARQYRRAEKQVDVLGDKADRLLVRALELGGRPTDVYARYPKTVATARKHARAAGIEPAPRGGHRDPKPTAADE